MNDNQIVQELDRLEKNLIALKTSQPVGTGSIRALDSTTTEPWDFHAYTGDNHWNGLYYTYGFVVVFTSHSQKAPFGTIRYKAEVDGVPYNPLWTSINGAPSFHQSKAMITVVDDITSTGNLEDYALDNTLRWRFRIRSNDLLTEFRIKVRVTATDIGNLRFYWDTPING